MNKSEGIDAKARKIFLESTMIQSDHGARTHTVITPDFDSANDLLFAENVLTAISRTKRPLFTQVRNKKGLFVTEASSLGNDLIILLRVVAISDLRRTYSKHMLHPLIELYEQVTPANMCFLDYRNARDLIELTRYVAVFRTHAHSPEFQMIRNRFFTLARNKKSGWRQYMNGVSARYGKLMLLLLDVAYSWRDGLASYGALQSVDAETAIAHRKKFYRLLDKCDGMNVVGFTWKLDYSARKAFSVKTLLIFDAAMTISRDVVIQRCTEMWCDVVTQGAGIVHDCCVEKNEDRTHSSNLPEGDVSERNEWYLAHLLGNDRYAQLKVPNHRTYGKGGRFRR